MITVVINCNDNVGDDDNDDEEEEEEKAGEFLRLAFQQHATR